MDPSQSPFAVMTLYTEIAITAHIAVAGFLMVSCFKQAVVDNVTIPPRSCPRQRKLPLALLYAVYLLMVTLVLAAKKAAEDPQ
jgi:hypothetical protein